MITTQQRTTILILQVICLLLFVVCRSDRVTHQISCDGDDITIQLSQQSDDPHIECADIEESAVSSDHINRSEYATHSSASLQQRSTSTGRFYPDMQHSYLPLVYLPVFSPPKINA